MKHKATATITMQIEAVFEHDGVHSIRDQANEALTVEAQWRYCMTPEEVKLTSIEIEG